LAKRDSEQLKTIDWIRSWKKLVCFLVSIEFTHFAGKETTPSLRQHLKGLKDRLAELSEPNTPSQSMLNEIAELRGFIKWTKEYISERAQGGCPDDPVRLPEAILRGLLKAKGNKTAEDMVYEFLSKELPAWKKSQFAMPELPPALRNDPELALDIQRAFSFNNEDYFEMKEVKTYDQPRSEPNIRYRLGQLRKNLSRKIILNGKGRKHYSIEDYDMKKRLLQRLKTEDIPHIEETEYFPQALKGKNVIWASLPDQLH
jgi:hypothetical protein